MPLIYACENSIDTLSELLQMFRDKHELLQEVLTILRMFSRRHDMACGIVENKDVMKRLNLVVSILGSKVKVEGIKKGPSSSSAHAKEKSATTASFECLSALMASLQEAKVTSASQ